MICILPDVNIDVLKIPNQIEVIQISASTVGLMAGVIIMDGIVGPKLMVIRM